MAKSKSGEFYSFDEVLRLLNIDESRLKRLISEGEIRAFREGGAMKFKRGEIDGLAGRTGRGSQTSETSLTEISLEDDGQPTVNVGAGAGETLSDDLLEEPDLTASGGLKTAEISSQDTFVDQGDAGVSTEPVDFTEDEGLGEDEEIEDIGADRPSRRSRPPPRQRVVSDEDRRATLIPVYFATDRRKTGSKSFKRMFGPDPNPLGRLSLGTAHVNIPGRHQIGRLERPPWFVFWRGERASRHVMIRRVALLPGSKFFASMRSDIEKRGALELFVFVHGYNVTWHNAVLRTAQLSYDLGFPGAPITYSWPSRGRRRAYPTDKESVEETRPRLRAFLEDLAAKSGATEIHLIAHSMGSHAVSHVLANVSSVDGVRFSQIVLGAPDIREGTFRQLVAQFQSKVDRTTLYASAKDKALMLARKYQGGFRRAGDVAEAPILVDGIDSIDATNVDTSFLGHGALVKEAPLIGDIEVLLLNRLGPERRARIRAVKGAAGRYWTFAR